MVSVFRLLCENLKSFPTQVSQTDYMQRKIKVKLVSQKTELSVLFSFLKGGLRNCSLYADFNTSLLERNKANRKKRKRKRNQK